MNNERMQLGVTVYHLKDKFAYGCINGNEVSEFKFDEKQMKSLFEFLINGAFDGMFDVANYADYKNIEKLNYLGLSRKTTSSEIKNMLSQEYAKKLKQLKEQKEKNLVESKGSQPE